MSIYLIRHGKTRANEERRYCGSTDLPLSEGGRAELKALSYRLPEGVRFVTSGMLRTEQTLEILFGQVTHTQDLRFREVDFGEFEMGTYEELKDTPAYQTWLTGDNERNVPPHGESGEQMTRRVLAAFDQLPDDTVLITHGGVIAAILASRFPGEGKNRYQWQPKPGHGYVLTEKDYAPIPGQN